MFKILVVDDEEIIRTMLQDLLLREKYQVTCAHDGLDALEYIEKENFDLVITDLTMPRLDGMELLKKIKKTAPETVVIIITAYATLESAVAAIKEGANDYMVKPFIVDEILFKIKNVLDIKELSRENVALKKQLLEKYDFSNIVGKSDSILHVLGMIKKISIAKSNVLIMGESGTGKELAARAIHINSANKEGPFLAINCSAIPENLLESELFGYKKGAFTGAYKDKEGLFRAASNGTLFLDEIGDMPIGLQIKLLRALEERVVQPIGSNEILPFNARIISATNKELSREVEKGTFREDLFYRLNVVEIKLPPLRQRKDDIPLLVKHFIMKKNEDLGINVQGFTNAAMNCLYRYKWKGNIRELENIVERAMILCETQKISPNCLPSYIQDTAPKTTTNNDSKLPLKEAVKNFEHEYITGLLEENKDDKKKTAEMLGISLASLYRKIEEFNKQSNI